MTTELEVGLYIFMLAGFLGYHIITRVPPLLHTPLMSATNAISGISLVGSLVVAGADYTVHGWQHAARLHRRRLLVDQRRRRLPDHRPHAARCSRRRSERARDRAAPVSACMLLAFGALVVVVVGLLYATQPVELAMAEYLREHVAARRAALLLHRLGGRCSSSA